MTEARDVVADALDKAEWNATDDSLNNDKAYALFRADAILSALAEAGLWNPWQPIETAPRDAGARIELWHKAVCYPVVGEWVPHYGCWVTPDRPRNEVKAHPEGSATHWRPILAPSPPEKP